MKEMLTSCEVGSGTKMVWSEWMCATIATIATITRRRECCENAGGRWAVLIPRASALLQRWGSRLRARGIFRPVLEGPQAEYQ
jgi:hypothetical protein